MPVDAEFEEKEFENPLYLELAKNSGLLWTPGLVFEFFFGIDACLHTDDSRIWDVLGFPYSVNGVILNDLSFGYVWRAYKKKRLLPTFKNNLFIQAKRPELMKNRTANQKKEGLKTPYWRFHKRNHQQRSLNKLSKTIGHRGLVIYASPAFNTSKELYSAISSKTLVEKTNFTKVENLTNHKLWAYDSAGATGYGCSIVRKYEDLDIQLLVQQLSENSNENEELGNSEEASNNLLKLAKIITEIVKNEAENNNPVMDYLVNFLGELYELELSQDLRNYIFIKKYCETNNLHWLVVG